MATTHSQARRHLPAFVQAANTLVLSLVLIALAACDFTGRSGPLAEGEAWSSTCPKGRLASYHGIDVSGTFAEQEFGGLNEQVLRDMAARTAVCGGQLRVNAFAGTSAQTFELYDGALSLPGATDLARWRRLPDVLDEVVAAVVTRYKDAVATGPYNGSDIVGHLRLATEYAEQLGDPHLAVSFTTDGIQTVALQLTRVTTLAEAEAFADELPVPSVDGELHILGAGDRSDGREVSSATVELVKAFWGRVCARTGAEPCTVATDYSSPIGSKS